LPNKNSGTIGSTNASGTVMISVVTTRGGQFESALGLQKEIRTGKFKNQNGGPSKWRNLSGSPGRIRTGHPALALP